MAFMLVALIIFFAMIALVYFSISITSLQSKATELQDQEAKEIVRKLSGSAELAFTSSSDCSSCLDLDKALMLKGLQQYEDFWNLDYLMIEKVHPSPSDIECTKTNYPNCGKITIISKEGNIATKTAFVSLVRWDSSVDGFKYELGRIHASGERIK